MELLTAKEVAERLKVTKQSISNWISKEGMPYVTRRPLRFNWEDVINWINRRGK